MFNFACRYCQSHLNAYIEGELPLKARRRVARHLDECPTCYHVWLKHRDLSENLERFVPMAGQPGAPQLQRIWESIEATMQPSSLSRPRHLRMRYGFAMLMMALGLLLPLTLGNRNVPFSVPSQPAPPTAATLAPHISRIGSPVKISLVITADRDHIPLIALQNTPAAQAY